MLFKFVMTARAEEDLRSLDATVIQRIVKKMRWFATQVNPLHFAEHLTDSPYGEYRFRIGDYRVTFDVKRGLITVLEILRIKHRREAYK